MSKGIDKKNARNCRDILINYEKFAVVTFL